MKHILPNWCKKAQIAMITQDITMMELAKALDYSRQYTSGLVNGRVKSDSGISKISKYLGISEVYN